MNRRDEKRQHVVVVGRNEEKLARTKLILKNFFSLTDQDWVLKSYANVMDLMKISIPERTLVISNESAFHDQEELHYLRLLKSKFNSATIVHTYKRFAPIHMDDLVVKATTKFVKEDVLFERNFERSLNVLYSTKKLNYGR
jgi:hypothetical protein